MSDPPTEPPGLALLLAVDASASVNYDEFDLMPEGTARAFEQPDIHRAIEATTGGITLAMVQWSSIGQQALVLDWTRAWCAASAVNLSRLISETPRTIDGGGTMIHAGLSFSARQFDRVTALRRVIDISGNGQDDDPDALSTARINIVDQGIVINGLAVHEDNSDLRNWYGENVIAGPGAFVVSANDYPVYAEAIHRKLLREIAGPSLF